MLIRAAGAVVALALAGAGAWFASSDYNRVYLHAGAGITAKQLCSLTFVSGLPEEQAREMYLDPLLGWASDWVSTELDASTGEVKASILGLWRKRAVYRPGLGCTLAHGAPEFDASLYLPAAQPFEPMTLDTAHRQTAFDAEALDAAVAAAFEDNPDGTPRNTLAVVVLHQGRLVAEAYGPNVSRETPLHGWSMTKSAIATLAGVMQHQGRIDVYAEGVPALLERRDDAGDVTLDALLRMAGGFAIREDNTGMDPNSRMLFAESDMVEFAATRERLHPPLEHWQYMSGNTILATDALQRQLGETLEEQVAGLRAELFEPLGIRSAVMEADAVGGFQGSSYLYMAAQDWARLAQLYVDGGLTPSGERLIPETWPDYVSTPTPGSGGLYGSGYWIENPEETYGVHVFRMSGFQGQYGYIVPEYDLVVIRMGATNNGAATGAGPLLHAVAEAMTQGPFAEPAPEAG